MARPTKLTAALADLICQSLRAGVPDAQAAEGNRIHRSTYLQWLELGRAADACSVEGCADSHHGPLAGELSYSDCGEMVMVAKADAVRLAVGYVTKAMATDAHNARWFLERRHPAEFKARAEVDPMAAPALANPPFVIQLVEHDRPESEVKEFMGDAYVPPAWPNRARSGGAGDVRPVCDECAERLVWITGPTAEDGQWICRSGASHADGQPHSFTIQTSVVRQDGS